MKLRSKIISAAVIVAVIGGGFYYRSKNAQPVYETEAITRGDVVQEVSVTGSIAPASKIILQPEVGARITKIPVKEGQAVKEGDVLISLDARDVQARVASQAAAVVSARARYDQLKNGASVEELAVAQAAIDTAKSQADGAVSAKASAETALANARQSYDNVRSKAETTEQSKVSTLLNDLDSAATTSADVLNRLTNPLFTSSDVLSFVSSDAQADTDAVSTRRAARASLELLRSAVFTAHANPTASGVAAQVDTVLAALRDVKAHADACARVLGSATNLSSTTLATYQANVNLAQTGINGAIGSVSTDRNGLELQLRMNATDITSAATAESNAEAALTNAMNAIASTAAAVRQAEANYNLKKVGARDEEIAAQWAQVLGAEATLSSLKADLAKRTILAPVDGLVTDIAYDQGETVQPGQTVITMQTQGRFEIVTNISEVDIAKIKVGDSVAITLDAFRTGERWAGKVVTIQPAEKVVEGVIFYETKIVFDQDDERLRSGMTANLEIETARRDDVLRVPIRSVKEKDGKQVVQVVVEGVAEERIIELGLENNEYVELMSGLQEGEQIVTATSK